MAWKASGEPTVRKQHDKWVVRVDGIDTETGRAPAATTRHVLSRSEPRGRRRGRPSPTAARSSAAPSAWLVRRYVDSRTDVSVEGAGAVRLGDPAHRVASLGAVQARLGSTVTTLRGVARRAWQRPESFSRRSVQVCRNVLRAALADAVDEGCSSAARGARASSPRIVAKPALQKEIHAWSDDQVDAFSKRCADHRWSVGFRFAVLLRTAPQRAARASAGTTFDVKTRTGLGQPGTDPTSTPCRSASRHADSGDVDATAVVAATP